MFKRQFILTFLLLNMTLLVSGLKAQPSYSANSYPYQKSQPFDSKYILSDFYFLGDITIHGNNSDNWELKDEEGTLITDLQGNKLKELSPKGFKMSGNDRVYQDMQQFKINEGKESRYVVRPINNHVPDINILIEKNKNIITIFIGNQSTNKKIIGKDKDSTNPETATIPAKGFKIIYDNDKFSNYLTQTYFYKILLNNFKDPVIGFGLGFNIDPTKIALINTTDIQQVVDVFNIELIFKVTKKTMMLKNGKIVPDPNSKKTFSYYDSEPLAIQDKIKSKNYEEQIKYADLFAVGAIKIEPLSADDGKKLDNNK